jgi:hypothetical protein
MCFEAGFGAPPSAMRPLASDSGAEWATDEGGGSTDDEGAGHGRVWKIHGRRGQERYPDRPQERYPDRPTGFLALTWHFRIPIHYHHLPRRGLGLGIGLGGLYSIRRSSPAFQ